MKNIKLNRFYYFEEIGTINYGIMLIISVTRSSVRGNWVNMGRNNAAIYPTDRRIGFTTIDCIKRRVTKLEIEYYGIINLFELTEDEIKLYIKD